MTDRSSERIYFEDPPLITMLSETRPRAKNSYLCDVCGRAIKRGEKHTKFVYIDDEALSTANRFHVARVHFYCGDI